MNALDEFIDKAGQQGLRLSPQQVEAFGRLLKMIRHGNEKVRLVSQGDLNVLPLRHFFDSITPLFFDLIPEKSRVMDLGTGGGFPGIPLAISRPDIHVTLVDANRKKMSFNRQVIRSLALENVCTVTDRVEHMETMPEYGGAFDVCVTRAVAALDRLLEWAAPCIKPDGRLICYKGPVASTEKEKVQHDSLFFRLESIVELNKLDVAGERCLAVFRKG